MRVAVGLPFAAQDEPHSKSVEAGDVFAHFVFPVGPIVAALRAPIIDRVADAFSGEDFGESVGWAAVLPLAGAGDQANVATGQLIVKPGIGKIGEIVDGIVEIEIFVVEAVHEITEIVDAGHGEAALENIRVAEQRIGSVVGAEGSTHGGDSNARLAIVKDKRDDFLREISIEDRLNVATVEGMRAFVVEAEAVDGIDCVELDATSVDEFGERADHALSFEFPLVTGAGRKTEDGGAVVPIDDDAEIESEAR
jgi:hypothetical protein